MQLIAKLYDIYLQHPTVTTDTRSISSGCIFFALRGPNFNGNTFAQQALQNGAAYCVIDDELAAQNERTILVPNVLVALQQLAKYHRQKLNIPVIAITGSNGKTTSKELVHAVLATTYITSTTVGNYNNHIGVPLTLLAIPTTAQMAIVEMGANHQKEIESYCTYTMPTHGAITNCGKAHLEGFGGVEGVKKGKGELYEYLRSNDGTAFVMKDYDYLLQMATGISKQYTYGTCNAQVVGVATKSQPYLTVAVNKVTIQTKLVGDYNLPNVLLAVAVGTYFNIPLATIANAITNYNPTNSRSQLLQNGTNTIILDAYNANPSSMKLAIDNIAKIDNPHKVLMLGAMAELGDESIHEHKKILQQIAQHQWQHVVLVGSNFASLPNSYINLENSDAAKNWYNNQQLQNCTVLIKGSRSTLMEKIVN